MKHIHDNNIANAFSKASLTIFVLLKVAMSFSTCSKTLKKIFFTSYTYITLKEKKNERCFCFIAVVEIIVYNVNVINNAIKSLNSKYYIDR